MSKEKSQKWVLHPHLSISRTEHPRHLTDQEIKYILMSLPDPFVAGKENIALIKKQIHAQLTYNLKRVQIPPSLIPEYITRIVQRTNEAMGVPGTPVGIRAAEALGSMFTQATLKIFHMAGQFNSSVALGIKLLADIIYLRENREEREVTTIYYKNSLISFEEAIDLRIKIVGTTVRDLIVNTLIDNFSSAEDENSIRYEWWHDAYFRLKSSEEYMDKNAVVLRLNLSLLEMYKHQVTTYQVADVLNSDPNRTCFAVPSPLMEAKVDIFPLTSQIKGYIHGRIEKSQRKPSEEKKKKDKKEKIDIKIFQTIGDDRALQRYFFDVIVLPNLAKLRLKGISGVRAYAVTPTPVWRIVDKERLATLEDLPEESNSEFEDKIRKKLVWYLKLDLNQAQEKGVSPQRLMRYCELAGLTILFEGPSRRVGAREKLIGPEYLLVTLPLEEDELPPRSTKLDETGNIIEEDVSPHLWIYGLTRQARKDYRVQLETVEGFISRPEILKFSEYMIGEAQGLQGAKSLEKASAFRKILAMREVDARFTTCNNAHVMYHVFGIESARKTQLIELHKIIASSAGYVHPEILKFIVEVCMSRGIPYGANFTNLRNQGSSSLDRATTQKAGSTIVGAAYMGENNEEQLSTSSAVLTGSIIPLGTGLVHTLVETAEGKTYFGEEARTYHMEQKSGIVPQLPIAQQPKYYNQELPLGMEEVSLGGQSLIAGGENPRYDLNIQSRRGNMPSNTLDLVNNLPVRIIKTQKEEDNVIYNPTLVTSTISNSSTGLVPLPKSYILPKSDTPSPGLPLLVEQEEMMGNFPILDQEYTRYLLVETIKSFFNQLPNKREIIEAKKALERWLIELGNLSDKKEDIIFFRAALNLRYTATSKFYQELTEKQQDRTTMGEILELIFQSVENFLQSPRSNRVEKMTLTATNIRINEHDFPIPRFRMIWLKSKARSKGVNSVVSIAGLILRYQSLSPAGQQLAVPSAIMYFLHESLQLSIEGFGSPLNVRLPLVYPQASFCSLFPDIDSVFGSVGSFFDLKLNGELRTIGVNPPFMESLLAKAANKVIEWCKRDLNCGFIFVGPYWRDSEFYRLLDNSNYKRADIHLKTGKYYYSTQEGKTVRMNVDSQVFVLCSDNYELLKNINNLFVEKLLDTWQPIN